jgi:restriction system protein
MAGRRKESGLDVIASLPWQAGIVIGLLAFCGIRYGIGAYFSSAGGPLLSGLGEQASGGMFAPLAWLALVVCWVAAGVSFARSHQRKRLLDTQTGLDSLRAMTWREFEMLVGEAFRRRGYAVEETGLGGKDGGIDLIVRKNGRTELVQCKQWKNRQVRASTIREMWGLVDHHRADGVSIVCVGDFTPDAAAFADGKAIELINGKQLLELVRDVQSLGERSHSTVHAKERIEPVLDASRADARRSCPTCGATMVSRKNRSTGQAFWGCSSYPRCKATQAI